MERRQHGTRAEYAHGCRCARCRKAWALYIANYRRRKGSRTRPESMAARDIGRTRAMVARALAQDSDVQVPVMLSPLAAQLLLARQERSGRSRAAVFDDLLRETAQQP